MFLTPCGSQVQNSYHGFIRGFSSVWFKRFHLEITGWKIWNVCLKHPSWCRLVIRATLWPNKSSVTFGRDGVPEEMTASCNAPLVKFPDDSSWHLKSEQVVNKRSVLPGDRCQVSGSWPLNLMLVGPDRTMNQRGAALSWASLLKSAGDGWLEPVWTVNPHVFHTDFNYVAIW